MINFWPLRLNVSGLAAVPNFEKFHALVIGQKVPDEEALWLIPFSFLEKCLRSRQFYTPG
jgi:hypothetical protein